MRKQITLIELAALALLAGCSGATPPATMATSTAELKNLSTGCAEAWSNTAVYTGGSKVSHKGTNYQANWWTQGDDPSTHSGVTGSGQPWTVQSACAVDGTAPAQAHAENAVKSPLSETLCLSVEGGRPSDGARVQLATCDGSEGQTWKLVGEHLQVFGNKCLDVVDGRRQLGTQLQIWECVEGSNNQAWAHQDRALAWKNSGLCVDVPASRASDRTRLQVYTCNGSEAQAWQLQGQGAAAPAQSPTPAVPSAPSANQALQGEFLFSPYKDVAISMNWNTSVISTQVTGSLMPVLQAAPNLEAMTWSFATGECGTETWGGISGPQLASANVAAWSKAQKGYILSTGGAAGAFTCGSDAGFSTFLDRYASDQLLGVDFDIEAGQSAAQIAQLVARVKAAQANPKYAKLRYSFTVATLGGNTPQSLGDTGVTVVKAIQAAGLTEYAINLMVMDYGSSSATNCVLDAHGACDMGRSAVQAAKNLHAAHGIPFSHIELTPMIGGNDTVDETFTLNDIATVAEFAKQQKLAGVHYWSLDRDKDCAPGYASPICNTYGHAGTLGFLKAFSNSL